MNKFLLVIALFLSFSVSSADVKPLIHIGGKNIAINIPDGYVSACELSKEIKSMFESSMPPIHSLKGCYLERNEFELYPDVDSSVDNPVYQIYSLKAIEGYTATISKFKKFRHSITKQQNKSFDDLPDKLKDIVSSTNKKMSKNASEILGESISLTSFNQVPLGVYSNTDNNIAFAVIRNTQMDTGSGPVIISDVVAINAILKDGKVIMTSVQKTYDGDDDIALVKELSIKWGSEL